MFTSKMIQDFIFQKNDKKCSVKVPLRGSDLVINSQVNRIFKYYCIGCIFLFTGPFNEDTTQIYNT